MDFERVLGGFSWALAYVEKMVLATTPRSFISGISLWLAFIALAGCASVPGEPSQAVYSAEDEALYLARFNRLAEGGSGGTGLAGAYDTLEVVRGAADPALIPVRPGATLSPEALSEAREYVEGRNTAAFIVWRDGVIEEESYFGEFSRDALIVSKSLAKPVTALLIGRAIQQGHIASLDQPVAHFITEWQGDAMREKILVRHLLDMRTGFLPQGFADSPEDILNRAYLHPRHDEIIINEYPVVIEPGSEYGYANATSELVAPLIERATGMRYGDFLSEALLAPIGAQGGTIWVNRPSGTAHSGCCVMLPARTFLKMAILVMQDGLWEGERLLPEGYVAQMKTGSPQHPYYGLGLWLPHTYIERRGYAHPSIEFGKVLHSEPYLDKDIALFDGNGNQIAYMIPSANMIVMRLGAHSPKDLPEWDNPYLPNLLIADAFSNNPEAMPEPQKR